MINIIFRFDDFSALSNTELENQIISTVKETNSTLTIGVIPFVCEGIKEKTYTQNSIPLTENKLAILKMESYRLCVMGLKKKQIHKVLSLYQKTN